MSRKSHTPLDRNSIHNDFNSSFSSQDILSIGLTLSQPIMPQSVPFDSDGYPLQTLYGNTIQTLGSGTYNFGPPINGDGGGNYLLGTNGDDDIRGYEGDDVLVPGQGDDCVDGGAGGDTVSYFNANGGVTVDLRLQGDYQDTGSMGRDILIDIENIEGSSYNDTLIGDDHHNILLGGSGDDVLLGGDGADVLEGGAGGDILYGGRGSDTFIFGDNWGNDEIHGEDGFDVLDFSLVNSPVYVALAANVAVYGSSVSASEHYVDGVEMIIGSSYDDTLIGNDENNTLHGGGGADWLEGYDGNDWLDGGNDGPDVSDLLVGGRGDDTIVWHDGDRAYGGWDLDHKDMDTLLLGEEVREFDSNDAALVNTIERIDMTWLSSPDTAQNKTVITLTADDVLNMTWGKDLYIVGDSHDELILVDQDGAGPGHWIGYVGSDTPGYAAHYVWSSCPDIVVHIGGDAYGSPSVTV